MKKYLLRMVQNIPIGGIFRTIKIKAWSEIYGGGVFRDHKKCDKILFILKFIQQNIIYTTKYNLYSKT